MDDEEYNFLMSQTVSKCRSLSATLKCGYNIFFFQFAGALKCRCLDRTTEQKQNA